MFVYREVKIQATVKEHNIPQNRLLVLRDQ